MINAYARHDRVILKPVESTEQTVGRVVLSDNGKEKANQYTVVAIGPGLVNPVTGAFTPTQWNVGDVVFVHKALVHSIEIDGEEYFVTRDLEILCGVGDPNLDLSEDELDLFNGVNEECDDLSF